MSLDIEAMAGVDATDFRAVLRSALVGRFGVLTRSGNQSIANNTITAVTWAAVSQTNISAAIWTSGNNTKIIVPSELNNRSGMVIFRTSWDSITGRRDAWISIPGQSASHKQAPQSIAAYEGIVAQISEAFVLTTGLEIAGNVWHNTGAARNVTGDLSLIVS